MQTFSGTGLYPTSLEKSVRLGYGLICNHPFLDGNKRIGAHAMLVTLALNNIELTYADEDLIQTIMQVAAGTIDEPQLLTWIKQHI